MNPSIKLIEKYKRSLNYSEYNIWCNKSNNANRYHNYDTDTILNNFISNITGLEIKDFPWSIRNPKGLWLTYSISNTNNEIMLGDRVVRLSFSRKYKTKTTIEKAKFLFIPYTFEVHTDIETQASKDQINLSKEKGFTIHKDKDYYYCHKKVYAITIKNLLFEIDKDTFDELEQYTLKTLKDRSIKSIDNIT